jgi:hypothetical protein
MLRTKSSSSLPLPTTIILPAVVPTGELDIAGRERNAMRRRSRLDEGGGSD